MRVCVIFNPVAKGNKARHFRRRLDEIGQHASLKLTRGVGDASVLASEAVREGFEIIVAAGGDGTLNEVLNGIGAADGFSCTRLGVLPLGTVNVFARELRLPRNLDAAWQVILRGREAVIDLPCATTSANGQRQHRWFAQLAGAGLDARAIELVNWQLKKRIGPLAYVYAGLQALVEKRPAVIFRSSEATCEGQLILIGNGKLYGGDFQTFETAQLDDGRLDVCVFPRVNFLTLLRCAGPLLLKGKLPASIIRRFQAAEFSLEAPGAGAFELDGELAGKLPARFSVERQRLRVIIP